LNQALFQVRNGEVYVTQPFEWMVSAGEGRARKDVVIFGKVVLAASDQLDPNAANADQQWRVHSIEVVRAVPMPAKG